VVRGDKLQWQHKLYETDEQRTRRLPKIPMDNETGGERIHLAVAGPRPEILHFNGDFLHPSLSACDGLRREIGYQCMKVRGIVQ
jgi:hypothetical protein